MLLTLVAATALVPAPNWRAAADWFLDPPGITKEQKDEAQHQADVQHDKELGKKYAEEAEKEYKLSTNAAMTERVQKIGAVFAKIANEDPVNVSWGDKHLSKFDYTYKVIQGKDVNAFSLPGGYIYVFEGLIKQAESDDELAGVIGHETAHAAFRHVATMQHEQQKMLNISLPLVLLAILVGGAKGGGTAAEVGSLALQAKGSGWSVKAEKAADYGGYQYMTKSPYNPTGMLTFMERLAAQERLGPDVDWGIFTTHPPSRERAEALAEDMQEDKIPIRRSKVTTSFRATAVPGGDGTVEVRFGTRPIVRFAGNEALKRADEEVDTLNAFFDTVPALYEVKAGTDGQIMARGRAIVTVTPADAAAEKKPVAAVRDEALKQIRVCLIGLGNHVWDGH